MKRSFFLYIAVILVSVSCSENSGDTGRLLPAVREILSDARHPSRGLLEKFDAKSSSGGIYIVGEPERVSFLLDKFVNCDCRDNIDGLMKRDSLPDFSGETFFAVKDSLNAPYSVNFPEDGVDRLRELAVRQTVSALDTVCHLSPYDIDGTGRKKPAKIIIFDSPMTAASGMPDVDTLFSLAGRKMPVLNPFSVTCDKLFRTTSGPLTVGLIARHGDIASGAYAKVFGRYAGLYGRQGCELKAFERDEEEKDPLREFLDDYMAAGNTKPLSAIIVDDYTVDVSGMNDSFREITSVMSSDYPVYEKILGRNLYVHETQEDITQYCYNLMRSHNIFTHNISLPRFEEYHTAVIPCGGDFVLIKDFGNVQK